MLTKSYICFLRLLKDGTVLTLCYIKLNTILDKYNSNISVLWVCQYHLTHLEAAVAAER
jgi:hypothetical protein